MIHWPGAFDGTLTVVLFVFVGKLVQRMLVYEPSRRISARAAMSHPWFDDLHQQYTAFRGANNQNH